MQKINLIPEVKQQQIKVKKNNLIATTAAIVVSIVLGATILVLLSYIVARKAQIANTDTQKNTLDQQLKAYSSLEKTVLSLETGLNDINTIISSDSKWLDIFGGIEQATPADIRFSSLKITADNAVTAELKGKDVNSINRFLKSFSAAQGVNGASAFTDLDVDSYTSVNNGVSFSAKFIINKDAF